MHCNPRSLIAGVFSSLSHRSPVLPPSFLAPSILPFHASQFSTSPTVRSRNTNRHRKDNNPDRGVSALRHTGIRGPKNFRAKKKAFEQILAKLPKPVTDPRKRSKVEVDENHGLWEFFGPERESLLTLEEIDSHGRAWEAAELRRKDWDDLWRLWWTCVKEKNRLATFLQEKDRLGNIFGKEEVESRWKEIKKTQVHIKRVLTERWYAWENARYAAMEDPEVNLSASPEKGDQAYLPLGRKTRQIAAPSTVPTERPAAEEQTVKATLPPPTTETSVSTQARAT